MNEPVRPLIHWTEDVEEKSALWRSENAAPKKVMLADDRMTADKAYRLACEGTALLWRGDFQNARQLLQAMARRAETKPKKAKAKAATADGKARVPHLDSSQAKEAFHLHRQAQSQRARTLGMLLLPFNADHSIPLRRAPDVHLACTEAYGAENGPPYVASLRSLLGLIGAHEWRKNGVEIPALNSRIHPYYGVFAPIRSEYVKLIAEAPLPASISEQSVAFDIGTGTGVLAAVLARRGIPHIIATDQNPQALECARDNLTRLGLGERVEVIEADLFPEGRAALVVCNPPWVPARPSSTLESAVYDPDSMMLKGFLNGLAEHLETGGEGWLILSDLAEHLGLRRRDELLGWIDEAGLQVLGRTDVKPDHPRVSDISDPLHAARAAELTSLWRLAKK